jgi:ribosomal protein S18 acetylase RimI-like enzyme
VLRAPWNQPRGSERDALEVPATHVTARDGSGRLLGIGRVHSNGVDEMQIRYMATHEDYRGRGVGRAIVERLEAIATAGGARLIRLNAREPAVGFYERLGYEVAGDGPTLFGTIRHKRMVKRLPPTR